ncbi:MAG TPA: P1 family peptidase, partial [Candidatus Obscuribacterales bacterium]
MFANMLSIALANFDGKALIGVVALGLALVWLFLRRGRLKMASSVPTHGTDNAPCCLDNPDEVAKEPHSVVHSAQGQSIAEKNVKRARPRQLGLSIGSLTAGAHNAITDVPGVKVGHATIVAGEGALEPGKGPVRTGVTAVLPHSGDIWNQRVTAGAFVLNGNGCVTGLDWIKELGLIDGPILLTNTLSVGAVYDAAVAWMLERYPDIGITDDTYIPIVGECDDGSLNDIRGRHVKQEHVFAALNSASSGPVAEGGVGAGTGMISYRFKGGIGTSSRVLSEADGGYTLGVLVNCNHGDRHQLKIDGVPVGKLLSEKLSSAFRDGSICIVVATDAPLNSQQLERIAKRAAMGLARTGA